MSQPSVGLLIVSHSDRLAQGVVELAGQMASDVTIMGAGGTEDGQLGSSFDKISAALTAMLTTLESDGTVVVIGDIGSSIMTAQTAIEFCDEPERVILANGPLVEGAVAGAVAAQQGGTGLIVSTAVEQAANSFSPVDDTTAQTSQEPSPTADSPEPALVKVELEEGLHARPAAIVARMASDFDAQVQINAVDAASVLALMGLGIRQGDEVVITAEGPQAAAAIAAISQALAGGLDEDTPV